MSDFDKNAYITNYSREHYRQYPLRVSYENDADIIEGIERMSKAGVSINAFIRECLRRSLSSDDAIGNVMERVERG